MKKSLLAPHVFAALLLITGNSFCSPTSLFPANTKIATKQAKQAVNGIPVHYYNGQSKVEMTVVLDEVSLSGSWDAARKALSSKSASVSGKLVPTLSSQQARFQLTNVLQNKSELNSFAKEMDLQGVKVQALLTQPFTLDKKPGEQSVLTRQFSLKVTEGIDAQALAKKYGATIVEEITYSNNTYILESDSEDPLTALNIANHLFEEEPGVEFASPLIQRQQSKKFASNDPLYSSQWHLKNTAQGTGLVFGNDVGIEGAWESYTGSGVNIAIVDDGLEVNHEDLFPNVRSDLDIDINYNDLDPTPDVATDNHGTSCAGVAAAKGGNSIGVSGAAPDANLIGVRLISLGTSDAQEAQGLGHRVSGDVMGNLVHISSNSWGPSDDAARLEVFGPLALAAVENAVQAGRQGKGLIYMWAAGNGRMNNDRSTYDGYASSRYTIAIAASGGDGKYSYYSEPGASILVTAPSSYEINPTTDRGIVTVDRTGNDGYNGISTNTNYTNTFGGTSSATPLAAGVVALMLEANPNLTWRDVQHVLVETAEKIDSTNSGWATNGGGYHFNPAYGFGRIDATEAVNLARDWRTVPSSVAAGAFPQAVNLAIPDNNSTGISNAMNITGAPENFKIEHVEVQFNATHTYRGDLNIVLTAPSGTSSLLATTRNDGHENYNNWMFTSTAHWGEQPNGNWTLSVSDGADLDTGTFNSWTLKFHGYYKVVPGPVISYDFNADTQGWFALAPNPYSQPTFTNEYGKLKTTVADNTNTFAFWESPLLPIDGSEGFVGTNGPLSLYTADCVVGSDLATGTTCPTIRLRTSTADFQQANVTVITSAGNGDFSPTSLNRLYTHLFDQPSGQNQIRTDFDILNFQPDNSPNATLYLDDVMLSSFTTSALSNETLVGGYSFFNSNTNGFTPRYSSVTSSPVFEATRDGLAIHGSGVAGDVIFGYWGHESDIALQSNHIYKVNFHVKSAATSANKADVPTFRLRMNDSSYKLSSYLNIESLSDASIIPADGQTKTYSLYFYAPPELNGNTLIFSFDYLWISFLYNNKDIPLTLAGIDVYSYPVN